MIRVILIITHTIIMRPYNTQQALKLKLFFGVFREIAIEKRQKQLSAWGFFSPGGAITERKQIFRIILMRFCF
jgi:hypothetical protein